MALEDDLVIDFDNQLIHLNAQPGTLYSLAGLYSFFIELDRQPGRLTALEFPIVMISRTEFLLKGGWRITASSYAHLMGGILMVEEDNIEGSANSRDRKTR